MQYTFRFTKIGHNIENMCSSRGILVATHISQLQKVVTYIDRCMKNKVVTKEAYLACKHGPLLAHRTTLFVVIVRMIRNVL